MCKVLNKVEKIVFVTGIEYLFMRLNFKTVVDNQLGTGNRNNAVQQEIIHIAVICQIYFLDIINKPCMNVYETLIWYSRGDA